MKRAAVAATVVLMAWLAMAGEALTLRPTQSARPPAGGVAPAAALSAILAAEDSRLQLPDDLHTPGIDTLRAKQMEDLRLLLEFSRSKDLPTQVRAIRALGRLERREVVTELLPYLTLGPTDETAQAIAQAFRGPALPGDTEGQQLERALDALVSAGPIPTDPRKMPGSIGPVSLAIGRLPYERADQVKSAESYILRMLRAADTDPLLRPAVVDIARGMEILARTQSRLATLTSDSIEQLRSIVLNRRHDYEEAARVAAMMALISARGVDEETLRFTARSDSATEKRLAVVVLGGAGAPVTSTERMELLTELLRDGSTIVRIEAVRAWRARKPGKAAASACWIRSRIRRCPSFSPRSMRSGIHVRTT